MWVLDNPQPLCWFTTQLLKKLLTARGFAKETIRRRKKKKEKKKDGEYKQADDVRRSSSLALKKATKQGPPSRIIPVRCR